MSKKWNIECDVDGVLADLYGSKVMKNHMERFGTFSEYMLTDYAIESCNNPSIITGLRSGFRDAYIIRHLEAYDYVDKFVSELCNMKDKANFTIHTLICGGADAVKARRDWLEDLSKRTGRFSFMIDIGSKSMILNTDILIEDCPDNIERSNAKYKILILHPYNMNYANSKKDENNFYIVRSLSQALIVIKSIINA